MRHGEMTTVSHEGNVGRGRAPLKPCPRKNYVCLRRTILRRLHVGVSFPNAEQKPAGLTNSAEEGRVDSGGTAARQNRKRRRKDARKLSAMRGKVRQTSNFFIVVFASARVEATMRKWLLAPVWALLKIKLHRLLRGLRRWCGTPVVRRAW
jgi:hypothetical protein